MSSKISMVTLFIALATVLLQTTDAVNHTVGDSTGWDIPPNTSFYEDWENNKNFSVGDVLVFNFATGAHDVAQVRNENDFEDCIVNNTIYKINPGPATITLNRTGDHYFVCTFGNHCSQGQKVKIDVESNGSTTPTNSPPGVSSPPPPPSGNSSASSVVATGSLVLMSIAFVLFC